MASILVAAGVLSYESIKKSRAKRTERKAFNETRFSELERDNAARIAQLQGRTCFCQTSDWRGGGCETHGYVPAAGEPGGPPAPEYVEVEGVAPDVGTERTRGARTPSYEDATTGDHHVAQTPTTQGSRETYPDYRYRRGQEDGAMTDGQGPPPSNGEDEVERINEERRKRMKAGGFTNWMLKRKGKNGNANTVVI